ncbi:MAG: 5-formyltetrahydrofolate cyclo-ligase [Lachnospiraceae bacterium]
MAVLWMSRSVMMQKWDIEDSAAEQKRVLRREMLKKRKQIQNRKEKSLTIQQGLLSYIESHVFDTIFVYVSYREEVETHQLIQWLLDIKMPVAVPKVQGQEMNFIQITSMMQLKLGAYGILEPENGTVVYPTEKSLILVPGAAFDQTGGRIGYGGGFYDRYFAKFPLGYKMGVCFEEQVIDAIPLEETDWRVDYYYSD